MPNINIKLGPKRLKALRRRFGKKVTVVSAGPMDPKGQIGRPERTESEFSEAEILDLLKDEIEGHIKVALRADAEAAAIAGVVIDDD